MSPKTRDILLLVTLSTTTATLLLYLIFSIQVLGEGFGLRVFGVGLALVCAVGALVVVAARLQRRLNIPDDATTYFEPPTIAMRIEATALEAFLQMSPPRQRNEQLYRAILEGLLPRAARLALGTGALFLALLMGLLWGVLHMFEEDDRRLAHEPTLAITASIDAVEPHTSRSGSYMRVQYHFELANSVLRGTSYADATALTPGSSSHVVALAAEPRISVLEGMRTTQMDVQTQKWLTAIVVPLLLGILAAYLLYQRYLTSALLREGEVVHARIVSLRQGGRGAILAKVAWEHHGYTIQKRLLHPANRTLYRTLYGRYAAQQPVLVLAHPRCFGSVYLIEPHLN